ncbi:MAG: hypothetical protein M3436_12705 [Pseudomonadota bacterium]|nr:hypothetical protein [Pseudomonadota bacterium]
MEIEILAAIIGAAATVIAAFIGVRVGRRPPKEDPKISSSPEALRRSHEYDVFISAPLAAYTTDAEIQADRDRILPLVNYLESELRFKVYWAGRTIKSKQEFDPGDISAREDVKAILQSKYFLLLYPSKIVSSVLFEAGIALRACLTSIYLVRDRHDLPFLMTNAAEAFTNVRICEFIVPEKAVAIMRKHGKAFFEPTKGELQ